MKLLPYEDLRPQKGITLSKTQIWRLEKLGKFPRRIAISAARHGWSAEEIDLWLAERVAERDAMRCEGEAA